MDINHRKFPVSLMLDGDCHRRLQAVSRSTRLSMSELVRLSVSKTLRQLGDPEKPDPEAVTALRREAAVPEFPESTDHNTTCHSLRPGLTHNPAAPPHRSEGTGSKRASDHTGKALSEDE